MKKIISILVAFLFLLTAFTPGVLAASQSNNGFVRREQHARVSVQETKKMRFELEARELYGEGFNIEPLYDAYGEASFLLGTTDSGFAIIERKNWIVYECGEANPYCGFESCSKYYGGALSYYVQRADTRQYFNIVFGTVDAIPATVFIDSTSERSHEVENPGGGSNTGIRLTNSRYITQYAFGFNATGTCNEVACCIALNYLKRQYNFPVCTTNTTPELFNGIFPQNANQNNNAYPKAELFHQRLQQYMAVPLLAWGSTYSSSVNSYLESTISDPSRRPVAFARLRAAFPFSSLYSLINSNKPVIVQTLNHPEYGNHTMAAYGCRTIGNTNEILVHVGWHDSARFSSTTPFTQKDHWVNYLTLSYFYSFILPGYN